MTYNRSNSIKKSVMLTTAALAAVTLGGYTMPMLTAFLSL